MEQMTPAAVERTMKLSGLPDSAVHRLPILIPYGHRSERLLRKRHTVRSGESYAVERRHLRRRELLVLRTA